MAINKCFLMPYTFSTLEGNFEEPIYMPSLNQQQCKDILCILQEFFKALVGGAATLMKTALAIFQLSIHYFSTFLFKALGIYLSGKAKKCYSSIFVHSIFTFAVLVHENDYRNLPIFSYFFKFSRHLTHPCQPTYFSVKCL